MKTKELSTNTTSLLTALQLAKGYANLGYSGYQDLKKFLETQNIGNDFISDNVSMRAIAAAMVFSFAIEIYLKALTLQVVGTYSIGHNLKGLIEKLPSETLKSVNGKYEDQVKKAKNMLTLTINMIFSDVPLSKPKFAPEKALKKNETSGRALEEAIALASPLFVKLRYLYEEVTDEFTAEIDFGRIICLLEAIKSEIYDNASKATKLHFKFSL
jgi:HEPN domain-containing protein